MTALLPLETRLRLARLALVVPSGREESVPRLAEAGANLVVLSRGRQSMDDAVCVFQRIRQEMGVTKTLLAVDSLEVGRRAGADLVYLRNPGQREAPPAPHPHALLGRFATPEELATLGSFAFAFVGPTHDAVQRAAVEHPPWATSSPVWFAAGGVTPSTIAAVLTAGARRVAASASVFNAADPVAACRALAAPLAMAWRCEEGRAYAASG